MSPISCARCGRALRSAASLARGRGRTCARRDREDQAAAKAALAGYTADQLAKAAEVLELGGIVATTRTTSTGHRIHEVITYAGDARHLVTEAACTCRAAQRGHPRCWHRAAVLIATAA